MFDSVGGDAMAAIQLGTIIRERELWTSIGRTVAGPNFRPFQKSRVSGRCASACELAFMGGVKRFASEWELGGMPIGCFNDRGFSESPQDPLKHTKAYVEKMGIDWASLCHSTLAASGDVYWFSRDELRRLSLVTDNN